MKLSALSTSVRLAAVVFCLSLSAATPAAAQGVITTTAVYPPPDMFPDLPPQGDPYKTPSTDSPNRCNPYRPLGCASPPLPENHAVGTYAASFDFPQVFVGMPGEPNDYLTYVSLKNQHDVPNAATVSVTWEGGTQPVTRLFMLGPQARVSARLNDWPELPKAPIGVTVEVRMHHKGTAGIAMHSARDFWRTFTILEGR